MRQWLADELRGGPGREPRRLRRAARRDERAAALQVPPAAPHRLPRHPRRRRSHRHHRGAVARWPTRASAAAWRWAGRDAAGGATARRSAPTAAPTGLAVIGMGKLGGDELNYSSDIDLIVRLRRRRARPRAGAMGRIANGEFFAAGGARASLDALEAVTEEGHVFRVDLRLRPEGRMGAARALARRLPRLPRASGPSCGSARR